MILLLGDSVLNVAGVGFSGEQVGFLEWIKYMAVPGLIASLLMMLLTFVMFKQTGSFEINKEKILEEQKKLGPFSRDEKVVGIWVLIALVLWSTDSLHHIDPGLGCIGSSCWFGFALYWQDPYTCRSIKRRQLAHRSVRCRRSGYR